MLPTKYRLKNPKAFDATYKNHSVVSDENIIIHIGKEKKDPESPTKFGFVVSKKYHKRAVKRNRIKRLLRETVRLAIKENKLGNLTKYMSFVITPRINTENLNSNIYNIQQSFYKLVEKIR